MKFLFNNSNVKRRNIYIQKLEIWYRYFYLTRTYLNYSLKRQILDMVYDS